MTYFSSLFWAGTGNYGDPFGPIIDVISDFGWSLLPQFPGSIGTGSGGGGHVGLPPPPVVTHPPIPVAQEPQGWQIEAETPYIPPVRVRPVGTGGGRVPTTVVRVEDVSTEVEQHPEGDFPVGSIFAPGRAWGEPQHELDRAPDPEDRVAIDWGGVLDWGLDTLAGQQPWQTFGKAEPQYQTMGFAAPNISIPSGRAALPPSAAYTGGSVATGDNCGNRRYVTLDRETGKISCKRRRRRRLLTNRDLADLASLKTITGGGAALNAAVIRAVR